MGDSRTSSRDLNSMTLPQLLLMWLHLHTTALSCALQAPPGGPHAPLHHLNTQAAYVWVNFHPLDHSSQGISQYCWLYSRQFGMVSLRR